MQRIFLRLQGLSILAILIMAVPAWAGGGGGGGGAAAVSVPWISPAFICALQLGAAGLAAWRSRR